MRFEFPAKFAPADDVIAAVAAAVSVVSVSSSHSGMPVAWSVVVVVVVGGPPAKEWLRAVDGKKEWACKEKWRGG